MFNQSRSKSFANKKVKSYLKKPPQFGNNNKLYIRSKDVVTSKQAKKNETLNINIQITKQNAKFRISNKQLQQKSYTNERIQSINRRYKNRKITRRR